MIDRDRRDYGHYRVYNVRCIEPSTHSDLEHRQINMLFGEFEKRDGSHLLKEGWRSRQPSIVGESFGCHTNPFGDCDKALSWHQAAVHSNALLDRYQVR